jgi:hypothetical protein
MLCEGMSVAIPTAIPDDIKTICSTVWTTDIKTAYKAKLIADKTSTPS